MRRSLATLLLCLAPTLVQAAAPHVELRGPSTAPAGSACYLNATGTVTEKPLKVRTQGPGTLTVRIWYDENQHPGLVELTAAAPGDYWVFVIATGTVDGSPELDFAPWKLVVTGSGPRPPPPGPEPPPPGPTPVKGSIYGVLVLPAYPTVQQAALRTNPALRALFAVNGAYFSSYLENESEVSTPTWRAAIAKAGGVPCMVWLDPRGVFLKGSKDIEASQVADQLKAIRGAK